MDLNYLLKNFENIMDKNMGNFKNIENIMYYNDEDYVPSSIDNKGEEKKNNYESNEEKTVEKESTFKKFSLKNSLLFSDEKYNYNKYFTFTNAVLGAINYKRNDSRKIFFSKLLRDFESFKLYKKYNLQYFSKKEELKNLLVENNDKEDIVKYLLSLYLNINIVLFDNDNIKLFVENEQYEIFKSTIYIYENEGLFYTMVENEETIFNSDNQINYSIQKMIINKNIIYKSCNKEQKSLDHYEEKIVEKKDYKNMKVKDLKEYAKELGLKITVPKKNGNGTKNLTKKEIIALIENKN
jgi:hypothetical protein